MAQAGLAGFLRANALMLISDAAKLAGNTGLLLVVDGIILEN